MATKKRIDQLERALQLRGKDSREVSTWKELTNCTNAGLPGWKEFLGVNNESDQPTNTQN